MQIILKEFVFSSFSALFCLSYHSFLSPQNLFTHKKLFPPLSACNFYFSSSNCSTYFFLQVQNEINSIISFSSAFLSPSLHAYLHNTHDRDFSLVRLLFAHKFLYLFSLGEERKSSQMIFYHFNFRSPFNTLLINFLFIFLKHSQRFKYFCLYTVE